MPFRTVATDRDESRRLIERPDPAGVVIEAGTPAGGAPDLCAALGVDGLVANTASAAGKFKHAQRQTDRDDARRRAELTALGQRPTVSIPAQAVRERRARIATRPTLVGRRVAVPHRSRAILRGQGRRHFARYAGHSVAPSQAM